MDGPIDPLKLALLVETSALRALVVNLYADKFMKESDPIQAAKALRALFSANPTRPPAKGGNLDPVISDLVSAMTDESIDSVMATVVKRVQNLAATV